MHKPFLVAALVALTAAAPAAQTPGTDKLLAALAKQDRAEALRRVLSIESLSGRPQPVSTPAEFVDRIIHCKITGQEQRSTSMPMTQVDWTCPDGKYRAWLLEDKSGPFVVVAEFWDPRRMAAEFDENGKMRPMRIAAPPPPSPSSRAPVAPPASADLNVLNAFGDALSRGSLGSLKANVRPSAKVSLGRRDVVHNVTRIEEAGTGPDALARILPIARSKVSGKLNLECKLTGSFGTCSLRGVAGSQVLLALVRMEGPTITNVELIYINPQTLRQDRED